MKFLEKDLEDIIWESDNEKLVQRNLDIKGKKIRQLRIGNFGISDIITVSKKYKYCDALNFKGLRPYLLITIYELKKDKVGISAFLQAVRYCKGIKAYLEETRPNIQFSLNIVLCGREVDTSGDFVFLTDLISGYDIFGNLNKIDYFTYNYTLEGINFHKVCDYTLTHKGF